jgi:hypothetical protein
VIEASVTIEVAARSGKALTRKAASESPTRAGKLTPAKSAAYTTATKSAAHMSAAESTAHTSATESAANVSATEPAAHMTATESTAHMTATESTAVSTTATVSAATSATRKRVGGQSPGESGSRTARMIMLLRNIGHTPSDATASGGECFVAANLLRRNLSGRRLDVVSPQRPFVSTGAHCLGAAAR